MLIITACSRVCKDRESNAIRHASVEKQIPVTKHLVTISFAIDKDVARQSNLQKSKWVLKVRLQWCLEWNLVNARWMLKDTMLRNNTTWHKRATVNSFLPPSTRSQKSAYAWKRFGKGRYIQTYVLFWKGKARAMPNLHMGNCFV